MSVLDLKPVVKVRRRIANRLDSSVRAGRVIYCGDSVVLTRLRNGRPIYLDMRDASVAAWIALGDDYEPHIVHVLRAIARPTDMFFDIGANVGYHTVMVRDQLSKGARAHVFEPNPRVNELLRRTVHVNAWWNDVRVSDVALSSMSGTAELTVYEDWWGGARLQAPGDLSKSGHPWAMTSSVREHVQVRLQTVDEYCREHDVERVDLMKLDVEGHEDSVIAGMTETLSRSPDLRLVMEFTFGAYSDADGFWNVLSELFPHRYVIQSGGVLRPVRTLPDVQACANKELVDLLLSRVTLPKGLG